MATYHMLISIYSRGLQQLLLIQAFIQYILPDMGRLTNLRKELRALYKAKGRDEGESKQEPASVQLHDFATQRPLTSGQHGQASGSEKPQEDLRPATAPAEPTRNGSGSTSPTVEHEPLVGFDWQGPQNQILAAASSNENSIDNGAAYLDGSQEGPVTDQAVQEDMPHEEDASNEPWSFEEEQAVRDTSYITFISEAPEDYTTGPPRLVLASDKVQDCVAMLLTYDMSAKIQLAVQKQREFTKAEAAGLRQRWALQGLQDDVEGAYASCRTRLAGFDENENGDQDERESLEQRQAVLEAMLHDVEGRKQRVVAGLENLATILREVQASVTAYLEEVFVCGLLIDPEEEVVQPQIESLDLEQEYLLFCDKLRAAGDPMAEEGEIAPLDYNMDHLKAEPRSEEDQKKQGIINDLWAAKQTLLQARNAFENRAEQRAKEYQANAAAANENRSTTDESPEAFDLRWIQRTQVLTRALIDAEAAYSAAKRRAHDEGVTIESDGDDLVSGFGEVGGDDDCSEYRMSAEQGLMPSVSSPRMRKWLSAVPEGEASPVTEEASQAADEWEAEEVGISDSVSLVAEGKERARIDRWRSACEKQE